MGTSIREIIDYYISKYKEKNKEFGQLSLYSLVWLYETLRLKGEIDTSLEYEIWNIISNRAKDERTLKLYLYDHEEAAGILFGLQQLYNSRIVRKDNVKKLSLKVLRIIKDLKWHDYDGEIMALSLILAHRVEMGDVIKEIIQYFEKSLDKWYKDPDQLRNLIYLVFALTYIEHEKLLITLKK